MLLQGLTLLPEIKLGGDEEKHMQNQSYNSSVHCTPLTSLQFHLIQSI